MSSIIHNEDTGLFTGGYVKTKRRLNSVGSFTNYSNYKTGKRRYFHMNSNSYGSGAYNSPMMAVEPSKYYYTFGCSVFTHTLSYNNRAGSGHMGIRQYDAQGSTAYYYMCGHYGRTTLTRAASAGDTSIYVADASGWYSGTSNSNNFATFFPASHPNYSTPYYYSRLAVRYNRTSDGTPYTNLGGGEYQVNLQGTLPNWGYSLPIGTPVGNGRGSNANSYIITGNTDFNNLNKWRTFKSAVRHGYLYDGGNFINGIINVRFLHLRNYRYRSEKAGDAARYYLANIMGIRRPNNNVLPTSLFQRGLPGPFY